MIHPSVSAFAAELAAADPRVAAVLFYGSNLRTGLLEGVLDFYVLTDGGVERGLWPRVSYREWQHDGHDLRAKIATMHLATFEAAAAGRTLDTTIWARFVQPAALAWQRGADDAGAVARALGRAAGTAAWLAAALGPARGREEDYWRALFSATYRAELRVEPAGRVDTIIGTHAAHFTGLLAEAWAREGIAFDRDGDMLIPYLSARRRAQARRWWARRRRMGRPLNVVRLIRAAATFDGAARYAAWKVERHTGVAVTMTPWRERHPLLSAPAMLLELARKRRIRET